MSTTNPGPTVTTEMAEKAITAYLAERPYSSRFKARNLATETLPDATVKEVGSALAEMERHGTLEKISYSSGASTYRPTDESQFRAGEEEG